MQNVVIVYLIFIFKGQVGEGTLFVGAYFALLWLLAMSTLIPIWVLAAYQMCNVPLILSGKVFGFSPSSNSLHHVFAVLLVHTGSCQCEEWTHRTAVVGDNFDPDVGQFGPRVHDYKRNWRYFGHRHLRVPHLAHTL